MIVPPSPVPPDDAAREPEPLGAFRQIFAQTTDKKHYVQFYAGWPVECTAAHPNTLVVWSDGTTDRPIVASQSDQGGTVVVIGDTHFAANENLESADKSIPDNIRFWRWLLSRVVPGQKAWRPPGDLPETAPDEGPQPGMPAEADEPSDEEPDQG